MDLFRNSSLGWFQSSLFSVQSTGKHHMWTSSCRQVHSADTTQEPAKAVQSWRNWGFPTSLRPLKQQDMAGTSWEALWPVSLYEVTRNDAQQCNVRWRLARTSNANQCLSSHCLWGHIYIPSKHHVFGVAKLPFTRVCLSKTFFHMAALAKYPFTSVPQQNIIWHNWISKETGGYDFENK